MKKELFVQMKNKKKLFLQMKEKLFYKKGKTISCKSFWSVDFNFGREKEIVAT
jgi:hypothetical protein